MSCLVYAIQTLKIQFLLRFGRFYYYSIIKFDTNIAIELFETQSNVYSNIVKFFMYIKIKSCIEHLALFCF